jgi:hypothetical protein
VSYFFDRTAAVSGTRREGGGPRPFSLSAPCCVLGGDVANPHDAASGPTSQRLYTLVFRRADWPDHLPPRTGDTVRIDGHPDMRINFVQPFAHREWVCDCRSVAGGAGCP